MKKWLLLIAALLLMMVSAMIALVLFVNPNQFKPLIIEQTKQKTGLELVIEGDISWQFFPAIGFELGKTALRNPAGFTHTNLLSVESVGVEVAVMPLFSRHLQIGNIRLEGAEIYLETLQNGRSNFESLTQVAQQAEPSTASGSSVEPATTQVQQSQSTNDWTLGLAGVTVSHARLDILDQQLATHTSLYDIDLMVSEFAADHWTKAEFSAQGRTNLQQFSARGSAQFKVSADFSQYALRDIALHTQWQDPALQIEALDVQLASFAFDQANDVRFSIKGSTDDMLFDMTGQSELYIDAALSLVKLNSFQLSSTLQGEVLPQSPMQITMQSNSRFDITEANLDLVLESLTANQMAWSGQVNVQLTEIPKIRFTLHSPNIDLDEFLGLEFTNNDSVSEPEGNSPAPAVAEVEPDLSALQGLDLAGKLTIAQFKAGNAELQNLHSQITLNRGVLTLERFSAELYQGKIAASAKLDSNKTPATYQLQTTISGVQVQPLLNDVADNDLLQGTGNIKLDLRGYSLTPSGIMNNAQGTVAINFTDGAVNGINVAQLIRTNYARLRGQKLDESEAVKQTDFSALTATLRFNQGEMVTKDLSMQSPLLRIRGQGSANYLEQTVDFVIRTSVVGTLTGQGGKDIDELRDVTIPIHISGQWAEPRYRLVFDEALRQRAQQELERGIDRLGEKVKGEEAKQAIDALRGLLRR